MPRLQLACTLELVEGEVPATAITDFFLHLPTHLSIRLCRMLSANSKNSWTWRLHLQPPADRWQQRPPPSLVTPPFPGLVHLSSWSWSRQSSDCAKPKKLICSSPNKATGQRPSQLTTQVIGDWLIRNVRTNSAKTFCFPGATWDPC